MSLRQLFLKQFDMPNGGPIMIVTDEGKIHDGYKVWASFDTKEEAIEAAHQAGYLPATYGGSNSFKAREPVF